MRLEPLPGSKTAEHLQEKHEKERSETAALKSVRPVLSSTPLTHPSRMAQMAEVEEVQSVQPSEPAATESTKGNLYTTAIVQPRKNDASWNVKQVLIDSGATLNLIPARVCDRFGAIMYTNKSLSVKLTDGKKFPLMGYVRIKVVVASVEEDLEAWVINRMSSPHVQPQYVDGVFRMLLPHSWESSSYLSFSILTALSA